MKLMTVDQFYLSSEPVFSVRFAFIMRKNFVYAEKIDLEFMWSDALGLSTNYFEDTIDMIKIKQNNGIWAPDSGPCEPVGQTEVCLLPSGSEYYSWGKRNKGKAQLLIS